MHDHGPDHQSDHPVHGAPPAAANLLPDGSPDWEAIEFDVLCSRCGYNLRTLTRPKCTECGLDFEWPEVLDVAAHRSDFLFEHNWRTRPVRSLVTTLRRAFCPRSFWQKVSMHERIELGPLIAVLFFSIVCFPLVLHGGAYLMVWLISGGLYALLQTANWSRTPITYERGDELVSALEEFASFLFGSDGTYLMFVMSAMAILLLGSFGLISGLRQTLGKCRVRTKQVFRVIAYSAIPVCFIVPAVYLLVVCGFILFTNDTVIITLIIIGYANLVFVPGVYFSSGLEHYLRLPRPRLLGFVAVIVSLLAVLTVLAFLVAVFGES